MIPEKETLTIEFKSDIQKIQESEIFEAVVAFANTDGGDIYIGVENNGRVTGVHEKHNNPVMLSAYVANNTVPPISVRIEMLKVYFSRRRHESASYIRPKRLSGFKEAFRRRQAGTGE
ncbi:MAG: ATP-binding protein [Synergistaceae bacterium]|nr:ATP-binding protein [Synergistaceae bacterium]